MRNYIIMGILPFLTGCFESNEYKWAFAQDMDGSFRKNEYCRESLAQTIYDDSNKNRLSREANTHVYIFRGQVETYRIYGFKNQIECETALTNMVHRQ